MTACALAAALSASAHTSAAPKEVATLVPESNEFRLVTYNVAGLPEPISRSAPSTNIPIIGGLLNFYDLAVVQEDFAYRDELSAPAAHEYRTPAAILDATTGIGDGLSLFSRFPFDHLRRVSWKACHGKLSDGSDCLAPKGFTFTTHRLAPGVEVDVYNVHLDSGRSAGDRRARGHQIDQLLGFMAKHSPRRAVIVAGDTNMGSDSEGLLEHFMNEGRLTDACRALSCSEPRRIDRVLYRESGEVSLQATELRIDTRFVRADGGALSDHAAVGVVFRWSRRSGTAAKG